MAKIPPINLSSTFNTFRTSFNKLVDSVGDLALLNTDSSTNIVAALNSVDSNQGTRTSLTTNVKTDLVSAINSLDSSLGNLALLNTPETSDIVSAINSMLDSGEAQSMIDSNLVAINASIASALDSAEAQAMFDSNFADSNVIATIANRSIANSKLTNNSLTVNGIEIALGTSGTIDITDSGTSVGLIKSTLKADAASGITFDSATVKYSLANIPNSSITNSTFSVNGVSGNLGSDITVDIVDSAEVIALARTSLSVTDAGGDGSLSYASGTGVFTYTGPSATEVRAHLTAGEGLDYDSSTGVFSGEDATTANKGIASFNSASFSTSSGAVSIKTGGVSNDQLAGSIANAKLANSTFSVNGVSGSLGANIEIPTIDSNGTINLIGGQFTALPATVSRSGDLTIDVSGDITLDADGGQIYLDDAGSQRGYLDIATASTIKLYTGASTLNSTWSGNDLQVEGDVTSVSDIRTKENIETITDGLHIVDSLRGVYYNKIGDAERKVGVIAQEVETVLPEVVKTNEDGMKSVDYGKMVGVLIEAIKDLKHEIDDLKRGL